MSPRDTPAAEQPTRGPRPDPTPPATRPPVAEPPKQSRLRRPIVLLVLGIVVLALIIGGVLWWLHARRYESTDDAFIDVHMTRVAPQVAGRVLRVAVDDNQEVKRGDLLVEIDPADYRRASTRRRRTRRPWKPIWPRRRHSKW